jgi:hypothetical protein
MGEVKEKSLNFLDAHLAGVALVVEKNETSHTIYIGLFCAVRIMLEA